MTKRVKRMIVGVAAAAMMFSAMAFTSASAERYGQIRIIPTNDVNVFSAPTYTSERLVSLKQNDSVLLYDDVESLGWIKIFWNDGVGYIHAVDLVTETDLVTPQTIDVSSYKVGVAGKDVTVYAKSGNSGSRLGTIRKGTYAVITGEEDSSYVVQYGANTGYIAKSNITVR